MTRLGNHVRLSCELVASMGRRRRPPAVGRRIAQHLWFRFPDGSVGRVGPRLVPSLSSDENRRNVSGNFHTVHALWRQTVNPVIFGMFSVPGHKLAKGLRHVACVLCRWGGSRSR